MPVLPIHWIADNWCSCRHRDCAKPGKHPLTPHGLDDATCDLDQIDKWWREWPDANIAEATGHYSDVMDLDGPIGEDGFDRWWADTIPNWSPDLSKALIVATPRPGQHWRFEPTGAGNRTGFLDRDDWRGRRGYALLPPSNHLLGFYRWLNDPQTSLRLKCPPKLAQLVSRQRSPGTADPVPIGDVLDDVVDDMAARCAATPLDPIVGDATRYGAGALRRACGTVSSAPEGERNDTLNREAFGIFQLVAGGEITETAAVEWLSSAAQSAGLSPVEVRRTIESAARSGWKQPRRAPEAA
jgi:hypothetical protein